MGGNEIHILCLQFHLFTVTLNALDFRRQWVGLALGGVGLTALRLLLSDRSPLISRLYSRLFDRLALLTHLLSSLLRLRGLRLRDPAAESLE